MDATMHFNSAHMHSNAVPADVGPRGLMGAGVHIDHVLAVLDQVQLDAQNLCSRVRTSQGKDQSASDAAELQLVVQQTLERLGAIQDDLASQQARLDALHEGSDERAAAKSTGARARLADSLRATQSESQAHKGVRATTQLHAAPAAASGLGDGGVGQEMAHAVQIPGGSREGLDGVVTLVGGMLRAASAPAIAGKQVRPIGWEARPDSPSLHALQDRWGKFVAQEVQTRKSPENMDINQLIQWVMREAYVGNTQDLRAHATRVEYYTQLKAQLRQELNRARTFRSEHRVGVGDEAKLDAPFDKRHVSLEPNVSPDGHWATRPMQPEGETEALDDLDAYIKKLDNALSTVGDDGQAAQLDLQNLSQKQAQLLNMLSNLSKAMHDTAMSIIRKIGN